MEKKIIEILRESPLYFKYLDSSYKNVPFILRLLKQNIDVTPYIKDSFKENSDIIKSSAEISKRNLSYFKKVPWGVQENALLEKSSNFEYIYHLTRNTQQNKRVIEILKKALQRRKNG